MPPERGLGSAVPPALKLFTLPKPASELAGYFRSSLRGRMVPIR